jgi:hypothetical protein
MLNSATEGTAYVHTIISSRLFCEATLTVVPWPLRSQPIPVLAAETLQHRLSEQFGSTPVEIVNFHVLLKHPRFGVLESAIDEHRTGDGARMPLPPRSLSARWDRARGCCKAF